MNSENREIGINETCALGIAKLANNMNDDVIIDRLCDRFRVNLKSKIEDIISYYEAFKKYARKLDRDNENVLVSNDSLTDESKEELDNELCRILFSKENVEALIMTEDTKLRNIKKNAMEFDKMAAHIHRVSRTNPLDYDMKNKEFFLWNIAKDWGLIDEDPLFGEFEREVNFI